MKFRLTLASLLAMTPPSLAQSSRPTSAPAPLSRQEAANAIDVAYAARVAELRGQHEAELDARSIRIGEHELRFDFREFGETRKLFISLHGGGGTTAEVNDQQWRNQTGLYEPKEGIYVAPRAPTDTWNLWHQAHIDALLDRLIETFVAVRGVDPDRVYLLGYSAGGDGVFQLAPRMADRFAAASMMAGHPNETQPHGLRILPFAIFMGGRDSAYQRNEVAANWGELLAELQRQDTDNGYPHRVTIYPECGHWMDRKDAEALPWMAQHTRNAWPTRIVWRQDDVLHRRFYWLAFEPDDPLRAGDTVTAWVDGQNVCIQSEQVTALTLRLSDSLLDLDQKVHVHANGEPIWAGIIERSSDSIATSLAERLDPTLAATGSLRVQW